MVPTLGSGQMFRGRWCCFHLTVSKLHQPEDGLGDSGEGPGGKTYEAAGQHNTVLTPSSVIRAT